MPIHVYFQVCRGDKEPHRWHWTLFNQDDAPIACAPQSYATLQDCLMALKLVKDSAFTAPVYDEDGNALLED